MSRLRYERPYPRFLCISRTRNGLEHSFGTRDLISNSSQSWLSHCPRNRSRAFSMLLHSLRKKSQQAPSMRSAKKQFHASVKASLLHGILVNRLWPTFAVQIRSREPSPPTG